MPEVVPGAKAVTVGKTYRNSLLVLKAEAESKH